MTRLSPAALPPALSPAQAADAVNALAAKSRCYQRDVLTGRAALSGSDLRGAAGRYAGRYAKSRRSVLARLGALGLAPEGRPWGRAGRLLITVRTTEGRVAVADLSL